jgi:hypothetical protein
VNDIAFVCENCHWAVVDEFDEDGYVECPTCHHTVHADTYLGYGGVEAIEAGEEWEY